MIGCLMDRHYCKGRPDQGGHNFRHTHAYGGWYYTRYTTTEWLMAKQQRMGARTTREARVMRPGPNGTTRPYEMKVSGTISGVLKVHTLS